MSVPHASVTGASSSNIGGNMLTAGVAKLLSG
jgi:hypothetical protein